MINVLSRKEVQANLMPEAQKAEYWGEQFPISLEKHRSVCRRVMKHLHKEVFIVRSVTIYGPKKGCKTELEAKIEYITAANTPVLREFELRFPSVEGITMPIYTISDDGTRSGARLVTTGDKYKFVPDVTMVTFKISDKNIRKPMLEDILTYGLTITDEGRIYKVGDIKPFIWSVSNTRTSQMLMSSVEQDVLFNVLETVNGFTFTRKGEVDYGTMKKMISRFGLFQTPAIDIPEVGNDKYGVLIIKGKMKVASDFMKFDGVPEDLVNDMNIWDGGSFTHASYTLDALNSLGANLRNEAEAACFNKQARANQVSTKVFAQTLVDQPFQVILERIQSDKGSGMFGEGYEIYGNPDNIVIITDEDGAKTAEMARENMRMFLLDIAKLSYSEMSSQAYSKFESADKVAAPAFLVNKAEEKLRNFMHGIGDEIRTTSLAASIESPFKVIMKMVADSDELGYKVVTDTAMLTMIAKEGNILAKSMVNTFKVDMTGMFQRAFFDFSPLICGRKVLRANNNGSMEVYSPDILWENREAIAEIENDPNLSVEEQDALLEELLTAYVIKYPTPGDTEFTKVVYRTWKQMLRAINYLLADKTDSEKLAVRNIFKFAGYGTSILAISNTAKRILAGMDIDYDGVVAIFNKELVAMLDSAIAKDRAKLEAKIGKDAPNYGGIVPVIKY